VLGGNKAKAARAFSRVLVHTKSLSQVLSEVVLVLVHLFSKGNSSLVGESMVRSCGPEAVVR
ncbi:hypothetical protein Tco_1072671, partial [Tanacetum coccineum]